MARRLFADDMFDDAGADLDQRRHFFACSMCM
jgi:hypothetical protein